MGNAMYLQIVLMCVAVAVVIAIVFSSRLLRTICREAVLHRRQSCEIKVSNEGVSVNRLPSDGKGD
jgi:hypothetical protein